MTDTATCQGSKRRRVVGDLYVDDVCGMALPCPYHSPRDPSAKATRRHEKRVRNAEELSDRDERPLSPFDLTAEEGAVWQAHGCSVKTLCRAFLALTTPTTTVPAESPGQTLPRCPECGGIYISHPRLGISHLCGVTPSLSNL